MPNTITVQEAIGFIPPGGDPPAPSTRGHAEQLSLLSAKAMRQLSLEPPSGVNPDTCRLCDENPNRRCRACTARRERAVRLAAQHLDLDELAERLELSFEQKLELTEHEQNVVAIAAATMNISPTRFVRLLEQHLAAMSAAASPDTRTVPNAPLRRLLAYQQLEDPDLNVSSLARRLDWHPAELGRRLGKYAASRQRKPDGRVYGGHYKTEMRRRDAEEIVRALGYAPAQLDDLLRRFGASV
jgi:hypothetical protein